MNSHPTRRRALLVVAAILGALALVAGTWVLAARFQSPAQRAASAEPPTPQPVLVPVTTGDLVQQTTMIGTVAHASTTKVALPLAGTGTSVVTAAGTRPGETLTNGSVVTWVNDRPIFALAGAFPLYRDLGPGDDGADVRLLQQALTDLGYGLSPDGDFGNATTRALRAFYKDRGVTVPTRAVKETPSAAPTPSAPTTPEGGATGATADTSSAPSSATTEATQAPAPSTPKTEPYLPMSEVLVIAQLPAPVDTVPDVGTTLTSENATLTLASAETTLTAKVPGAVAAQLTTDTRGTAQWGGASLPVAVTTVAGPDPKATEGEDATNSTVTFAPTDGQIPAEWVGHTDILLTVDLVPPLKDALLVPQRALATDSTGTVSLLLEGADGAFTQVAVTQKACVAGTCAIEAGPDSGVTDGARVRVDR